MPKLNQEIQHYSKSSS